jgi:type II secretory pathway pseudopilin PulG
MHASTPRSPSRAAPTRPRLLRQDEGVSEVVGYLLVFGILSIVLVLSMTAFAAGQQAAQSRAVQLRAESAAARVAGVVVQTAVLWEQQGSGFAVAYLVDLPQDLEGRSYVVRLEPATTVNVVGDCTTGAHPDQVCVQVPSLGITVTAPVFSAAAPTGLDICRTQVQGGALNVRINLPTSGTPAIPAGCKAASDTPANSGLNKIFLEAT